MENFFKKDALKPILTFLFSKKDSKDKKILRRYHGQISQYPPANVLIRRRLIVFIDER